MSSNCPHCGNQLDFVQQYNQWFCLSCQSYQLPPPPPEYQQQGYQPPPPPPDFKYPPPQYQQSAPPHYQQNFPSSASRPPVPKKNKAGAIIVVVVVVVIIILASVGYTLLIKNGDGDGGGNNLIDTEPSTLSAPLNISASTSGSQNAISWADVPDATSYNIYWSTTSGVTKTSGTKIPDVTSPYIHAGRVTGTIYYYIVTAVNTSGESEASTQVSVRPTGVNEILTGKIAFISNRDGNDEIYTMNPDGSNQVRITPHTTGGPDDKDYQPVWSPNAERIAFTSWRDGLNELFAVNSDGTAETRLTSIPVTTEWNDDPCWSPDGSQIAFVSYRTSHTQIYTMNADGSNQNRLTFADDPYGTWGVGGLTFTYPSWSPDGSQIACDTHWSTGSGDGGGIYVFSVNTGSYTQLTHSADDHNAIWSPDGSKIAFYRQEQDSNYTQSIYIMGSDGSGLTRLTEGVNPAWSPDGSKIAFISNKIGSVYKLFVIQSDGSGEVNLMSAPGAPEITWFGDWTPSWSPDGKKLVFEAYGDIYTINIDGSSLKRITTDYQSTAPVWSPE
jgi:Tol biopolymer transport system component